MTTPPRTARLLEIEPDLARFLSEQDRAEAQRLTVPVLSPPRGVFDLHAQLAASSAFGSVVLDGLVLQRLQVGNHLTMKVFGSGDTLPRVGAPPSALISDWAYTAAADTRLALLGREWLAAVHRWPALTAGLHMRMGEQAERMAVQLAICQLPRVEERLLAILWWLAEAWGRVTSVGTVVPLSMTHDVLGALVGARRPTVTLALGELSARGAIARQDHGWLLLEPPPQPAQAAAAIDDPALILPGASSWQAEASSPSETEAHAELLADVRRLRAERARSAAEVSERLTQMLEGLRRLAVTREVSEELAERVAKR
jgi:hypothetical protein